MNPTHEFLESISSKIGEMNCKFSILPIILPMIFFVEPMKVIRDFLMPLDAGPYPTYDIPIIYPEIDP